MEARYLSIFLVFLSFLSFGSIVVAQDASVSDDQVINPSVERREIRRADIDTENFEIGAYYGVLSIQSFGFDSVVGIKGAYHFTEDLFAEANYGFSKAGLTDFEKFSGSAPLFTEDEREFTYWNINLGYNILPGEAFFGSNKAFNNALYLVGGIGSTSFIGDKFFTVNVGLGYRLLLTDSIALHLDLRDHIFKSNILGADEIRHHVETTVAATWFF
jgi:outer membrane beta-barrel protein